MIGLAGDRRLTMVKPAFLNVVTYPVPDALGERSASRG
jgi:hypothetical protein